MTAVVPDRMLMPREAADLFGVHVKTLNRWANAGLIGVAKTPHGHRRYRESEVRALMESGWHERREETEVRDDR